MPDGCTRRRLLRASTAAAIGLGGIGAASASDSEDQTADDDVEAERIPPLDLSDAELRTETLEPSGVPERADGIRPGSQIFVESDGGTAGCTANFVWRDASAAGEPLYIGAAGHCFLDGPASENAARGHEDGDDVSGLTVTICADCSYGGLTGLTIEGAVIELGDVVYARQVNPEQGEDGGVGHDFGLVRIPADAEDLVDPSLPQFGGPHGVSPGAVPEGSPVHQYGAGVANGEVYPTMGSTGLSLGDMGTAESWYSAIRASPGDSGSPLVASDTSSVAPSGGPAAGILTHITTTGTAGTTMRRCKAMPPADGVGLDLEVVQPGES